MKILNADFEKPKRLFYGLEVEKTSFVNAETLFVVDLVPIDLIFATLNLPAYRKINHIYLGAGGLSRIDLSTAQALLDQGYAVTIEAAAFPQDLSCLGDRLWKAKLVLMIPASNTGVVIPNAVESLTAWLSSDIGFQSKPIIYLKIDDSKPNVFLIPLGVLTMAYTHPSAYANDVPIWSSLTGDAT